MYSHAWLASACVHVELYNDFMNYITIIILTLVQIRQCVIKTVRRWLAHVDLHALPAPAAKCGESGFITRRNFIVAFWLVDAAYLLLQAINANQRVKVNAELSGLLELPVVNAITAEPSRTASSLRVEYSVELSRGRRSGLATHGRGRGTTFTACTQPTTAPLCRTNLITIHALADSTILYINWSITLPSCKKPDTVAELVE